MTAVGGRRILLAAHRHQPSRPAPPEETTVSSSDNERVESVRSAWTRRLRQEALRMRRPEVSKIIHVGVIIATYADADGTNATMAVPTLAGVVGCSQETVTRAVRVLVAVGLMDRKRRPNRTATHTLLIPLGAVDWDAHLHLYTATRQRARRERILQEEVWRRLAEQDRADPSNPYCAAYWAANPDSNWRPLSDPDWTPPTPTAVTAEPAGTPSADAIRNPFPTGVPEPVPAGGSGTRSRGGFRDSGTRSRTGAEPVPGRGPEPVPDGGVHRVLPPVGDPSSDTDLVGPVPQPQVRARETGQDESPATLQALAGGGRAPGGQPPLLLPVPDPAPLDHALIAAHMTGLYGTPVPVRRAAHTAVEILGDLDPPDPTAHVLAALDADPGRYRPHLPLHPTGRHASHRHATGT